MWKSICTYHVLENLIPPTLEEDKNLTDSLTRLESLSACAIVRDTNNCKWLSEIPPRLHHVIWKAYLRDEYYCHRNRYKAHSPVKHELSALTELLYHWPYEVFILKEIMPSFPAKLSWFSRSWHDIGPYVEDGDTQLTENTDYLERFYSDVVEIIFENFTKSKSKYFTNKHSHECKIQKLNISGFSNHYFIINQLSELSNSLVAKLGAYMPVIKCSKTSKTVPSRNKFQQNRHQKPKPEPELQRNHFGNPDGKLEVILDAKVSFEGINEWGNKSEVRAIHNFNLSTSNTIYRCGRLVNYNFKSDNLSKFALQVIGKSINKETESIYIWGEKSETELFKLMNVLETSNILSLALKVGSNYFYRRGSNPTLPINILKCLKNLQHLDISHNNLHGKLEPLLYLEKGLQYLGLYICNIHDSDLEVILRSSHKSSLLELNLSTNRFNGNGSNMIKLFQELPKVIKLNIEKSMLEELHEKDVRLLCDSINSLPNLAHLNLLENYLSMDIIKLHLTSLRHSRSLRLLELQMPVEEFRSLQGDFDEKFSAMKKFSALINTAMNKDRSELLYVDFGDKFFVRNRI